MVAKLTDGGGVRRKTSPRRAGSSRRKTTPSPTAQARPVVDIKQRVYSSKNPVKGGQAKPNGGGGSKTKFKQKIGTALVSKTGSDGSRATPVGAPQRQARPGGAPSPVRRLGAPDGLGSATNPINLGMERMPRVISGAPSSPSSRTMTPTRAPRPGAAPTPSSTPTRSARGTANPVGIIRGAGRAGAGSPRIPKGPAPTRSPRY